MKRKIKFQLLNILATAFIVAVLAYSVLSTTGIITSFTYKYVYPYIRAFFHIDFIALSFDEISFDVPYISAILFGIPGVIMIHLLDVYLYMVCAKFITEFIAFIVIRRRLGRKGYNKLFSIRLITENLKQEKLDAIAESYAHVTLRYERINREKKETNNAWMVIIVGMLIYIFCIR